MRDVSSGMQVPLSRRLRPLVWGMAVVVILLLGLSWGALKVQVALAGFLNGESIWSKAQKQAVIDLDAYAGTGDPRELERFRSKYKVLLDYRYARDASTQADYDYPRIAARLQEGRAMPQAIPMIIFMLRHFQGAPYVRDALAAWRATDARVERLDAIARELEADYASGDRLAPLRVQAVRSEVAAINAYIEPLSNRFSVQMAHAAVWVSDVLFAGLVLAAVLAIALWLWLARRILQDMRGTEERFRLLFNSAAEAIVMVEEDAGTILHANRMASAWTGISERQLRGRAYFSLFDRREAIRDQGRRICMLRGPQGQLRPVEVSSSVVRWGEKLRVRQEILHDLSERMEMDRERRIASQAMANVAEGVIISDARRRILSINAAYRRMTGYDSRDVEGQPIDAWRRMPDGVPLPLTLWDEVARRGHWSGEVQARRHDGSLYPELLSISAIRGPDGQIEHFVAVCTDITEGKAAQRHLQYLAAHDTLTGLANRSEFEQRLSEVIVASEKRHQIAAVVFLDLDNFKLVNDSYSHAIGDRLLLVVAERIQHLVPTGALAGRIGGDEFTVLLSSLKMRDDASALAGQLIESMALPFQVEGCEIALSASIGIATFPLDGHDASTLITNAHAAMHNAKQEGHSSFRFYNPRMRADANRRLLLLSDLRRALDENQFRLVFQPSVRFADEQLVGAEALVRWQHPDRGPIQPAEFVPIAESLGLIRHIDAWVLNEVCRHIAAWKASGLELPRIAVNISASWFSRPDFVEHLTGTIRHHGIPAAHLMLEITEGTILRLGEATRSTMSALHALGVAVAIDDFGTGYSSLAYLKLPAVACLKIDRSFVLELPQSTEDAKIVQAMIVMARSLGLEVIAEGVETEAQHAFLRQAGCAEGQGFLYARPVESEDIERMFRRKRTTWTGQARSAPPAG